MKMKISIRAIALAMTFVFSSSYAQNSNKTFTVKGVSFTMVYVEGGSFIMGDTSGNPNELLNMNKPPHRVTVSSFMIGKTEVTQALWKAVMGNNPSSTKGNSHPVEYVSWNDCQKFITKLNKLTGQHFRLPTEAEWEFASRGGVKSRGYKYSGSNNIDKVAWYGNNSYLKTQPVATKTPNELGIHDMSGNVSEWCQNWTYSYKTFPLTNPQGPSGTPTYNAFRAYRGGDISFKDGYHCKVYERGFGAPDYSTLFIGFRLAM